MELTKTISETKLTKLFLIIEKPYVTRSDEHGFPKAAGLLPCGFHPLLTGSVQTCGFLNCDVLLADQASAAAFPSNFISDLLSLSPGRKAILFGMEDDPEIFLQAVRAGMSGYLLGMRVPKILSRRYAEWLREKRFPLRASVIIYFSWLLARHAKAL